MSLDLGVSDAIIGSYLKGKNLKAKIDQQKAGNLYRQQQLAQQQKEFEDTLKLHTDQFNAQQEHQKAEFGLAANVARIQTRQAALQTGMGTSGTDDQGNETLTLDSPVAGEAPITANVSQYRKFQNANTEAAAKKAGAVAGAESAATTPGKIQVVQATGEQQRQTQGQKQEFTAGENEKTRTFHSGESALDRASKERIANLTGQWHLRGIQIGHNVDDAETNANYAADVYDLTTPLDKIPVKSRNGVNNLLRSSGFKAPDKDLGTKLDAFKGLSEILTTGGEVTDKLSKSTVGAVGQRVSAATGLTDLGKKVGELQARAGAIVKSPIFANDRGNIALKEVDRALNALGKPGLTFTEGVDRMIGVQRAVHDAIDFTLKKYPDEQQHFYKAKLPRAILQEINRADSIKAGHLVYDFDDGSDATASAPQTPQPTIPIGR